MGYWEDRYGITLIKNVPRGTCPMCARRHNKDQPHDEKSPIYQQNFYDEYGRYPTWSDAIAHCPPIVKKLWIEELKRRGEKLN